MRTRVLSLSAALLALALSVCADDPKAKAPAAAKDKPEKPKVAGPEKPAGLLVPIRFRRLLPGIDVDADKTGGGRFKGIVWD